MCCVICNMLSVIDRDYEQNGSIRGVLLVQYVACRLNMAALLISIFAVFTPTGTVLKI